MTSVLLSVLLLSVCALSLLALVFHLVLLKSLAAPRVPHEHAPAEFGVPTESLREIELCGSNNKRLFGWLIWPEGASADRPVPAVLVMHGWGSNAAMMLPVAKPLRDAGYASLFLDARCHGQSEGEWFMSMPRFAEDVATGLEHLGKLAWVDQARLSLIGHSVGAGAVLLHASVHRNVCAVISLSAFTHPREVMQRWADEKGLSLNWLVELILWHVQRVIGARFDDIAPVNTVARLTCPVMIVHGREDEAVPVAAAHRVFAEAGDGTLLLVDGGHDLRDALEPYTQELIEFLKRSCDLGALKTG